jgi:hypothetical protein
VSDICYFSIYGGSLPTDDLSAMGMTRNVLHCRLTSWVATENEGISRQSDIDRIRFISDYFNDTDGQIISQRERSRLLLEDQHFTYGEIDPNSFIQILRDGEAFDGQIFYDLGSGSGKSLVTAALSGFSFLKVVGIEYLSGLCDASKILLENLKKLYEKKITFNGKSLSDYSLNSVISVQYVYEVIVILFEMIVT